MSRNILIAGFLAAAVLALVPWFMGTEGYHIELFTVIFYWIGLAGAWNLMSGYTGYIDFGSATYTGVGAYVAGILITKAGWPLLLAVGMAGVGGAVLALIVGFNTLRLRGAYFAIASFALATAMTQVAEEWESLTEGGIGLTVSTRLPDMGYYFVYLLLALAMIGVTYYIDKSRMGYALKAINENEAAARQVGIDTHRIKMAAYCIATFFMAVLGSLDSTRLGYFKPEDVFNVHITIKMVIMNLLGGMGTVAGPLVGATFLTLIEDFLGEALTNVYLVIVGVVIVAVIMYLPRGIAGGLAARFGRLGRR